MKNVLAFLLSLLFAGSLFSQELSLEERKAVRDNVFSLLTKYYNTLNFKELGSRGISDYETIEFIGLFAEEALVFDPINPEIRQDEKEIGFYEVKEKPVREYVRGVTENFPDALTVKLTNIYVDFDSAYYRRIRVLVEKETEGVHAGLNARLVSVDTSLLILQLDSTFQQVQILGIQRIGSSLANNQDNDLDGVRNEVDQCPNRPGPASNAGCPDQSIPTPPPPPTDRDNDGIYDRQDKCPDKPGPAPHGCPDTDGDGYADHVDKCIEEPGDCRGCPCADLPRNQLTVYGAGSLNALDFGTDQLLPYPSMVETGQAPYEGLELDSAGSSFRLGLGIEWDFFFSAERKLGIGLGAHYTEYVTSGELSEFHVQYPAQDAAGHLQRRILTVRDLQEEVKAGYLTLPLLLKFRSSFAGNDQVGFFVHLGPALSFQLSNRGSSTAIGDYEAVYDAKNGFIFNPSGGDWLLTRNHVGQLAGVDYAQMKAYFDARNALFGVAIDEKLETTPSLEQGMSIGAIGRIGLYYHFSKRVAISLAGQAFTSSAKPKARSDFKLSDQVGELNSLFSGLDYDRAKLTHYGVTLGLVFGFNQ